VVGIPGRADPCPGGHRGRRVGIGGRSLGDSAWAGASQSRRRFVRVICSACSIRSAPPGGLCRLCACGFFRGGEQRLDCGLVVRSPFSHAGTARLLVHRLKYGAQASAAGILGSAMGAALPPGATALIPVPRSRARLWRYGVDPAPELAAAVSRITGVPVVRALAPSWWHRRRAGSANAVRGVPRFEAIRQMPDGAVLVDDVVTTGATLTAAAGVLGAARWALTATAAPCRRLRQCFGEGLSV
jgi:predicted amidophosphoribosyltransferase